ncbi:GPI-anchored surface protein, putative [Bodo saltans]|uniref:GPI-anchored surface protein, putative n=1 Tax=Bodo saltans TaxID=75058 RepID=A0A0S4JQF5_BODSA|nr:GPI-anchored surface protein, putative [Bodo saltans]|eukprot:CUG93746.1 GPI-anchored surface protein, putative [Bodo saltans]
MSVSRVPKLGVVGSGRYAMSLISSLADAVEVDVLQIVWILPNTEKRGIVFDGHGWNASAASITVDPFLTSLKVSAVVCGNIYSILTKGPHHAIYCGGQEILCDAITFALDPYHDMDSHGTDDFLSRFGSPRPIDELNYLRNVSEVELNLLNTWQTDELKVLVTRGKHQRYIQSSLQTGKGAPAAAQPTKLRDLDEEEGNADDDDDMEYDRPTVLVLKLPRISTKFAESLLSSSQMNPPELVYFAMNEGERCLSLRNANIDDAELNRLCTNMRTHYLLRSSVGGSPTLVRDVSSVDVSHNSLTTLNSITETFFLHTDADGCSGPISSMLRQLDVSHNPLEQRSVTIFLSALLSAGSVSHLASLNLCHCGLSDGVAEALCSAITRMTSLVTLDVSGNHFSPLMNGEILLAARHHIKSLNVSGLDLQGCETQLEKLFRSHQLERIHCSSCGLEDSTALCVGTQLVQGECRGSLRVVDFSNNPGITSEGVKFLLECIVAGLPSDACRMQDILLEGCGGVGVHEVVAAANVVQHCRALEQFTFSIIFEEQLCLQVFIDCVAKYGNSLVHSTLESFVFPSSRCNTSESTPTAKELPQSAHDALHTRLAGNKARRAAREEQLASRALSIATATDLAAEATRSLPVASGIGVPTHYLRIDDSANAAVYADQSNSADCDEYRYRRYLEALRSEGDFDVTSPTSVAGYACGTVDTWQSQWAPFRDAQVVLRPPVLPKYAQSLTTSDSVVVDDHFFISEKRKLLMVGCGCRTRLGDAPFTQSTNSGVHDAMYSRLILPIVRQSVFRVLAPKLVVPIPRIDLIGVWMGRDDVPPNILRQKILENVSLSFAATLTYMQQKQLKQLLNEVTHRIGECQPALHDPLHQQYKRSESALLDALAARGSVFSAEVLPPPPPPPAQSPPTKKDAAAPVAVAQPAILSHVDSNTTPKITAYHIVVESLKTMLCSDMLN